MVRGDTRPVKDVGHIVSRIRTGAVVTVVAQLPGDYCGARRYGDLEAGERVSHVVVRGAADAACVDEVAACGARRRPTGRVARPAALSVTVVGYRKRLGLLNRSLGQAHR